MRLGEREINTGIIHTNENCRGCNKCLNTCPVTDANLAFSVNGANQIMVDPQRCILCGRCITQCTHHARTYHDDTERFFTDLTDASRGPQRRQITLLVAPSFIINYPTRYRNVLGYLKHLGINHIINASYGADIAVWCYLKHLTAAGTRGLIAQPCPAIVRYVEMHRPELRSRLMPIQSPVMCTAIYLKKYAGLSDTLAFLGPCIAKKSEFERPENRSMISYNVTFEQLMKHIGTTDISGYDADDSELDYGMGALFPASGGMRVNLEYYLGLNTDTYITKREGEVQCYPYLDLYANQLDYDDPCRPLLIDILNCQQGCNYGTATEFKTSPSNHIPCATNRLRVLKTADNAGPQERLAALNRRFAKLHMEDFVASYHDCALPVEPVSTEQIEKTFRDMLKRRETERTVDCSACGMHSCRDMAAAIVRGNNFKENCIQYIKKRLVMEENEALVQRQKYELLQSARETSPAASLDQLTGLRNRYEFELQLDKSLSNAYLSGVSGYLFLLDLDDFKTINDSYSVSVGNSFLIQFALFLKENFSDRAYIYRMGGDEFMLLFEHCTQTEARQIADTILKRTQKAWDIFGVRFYCTASIGAARFPDLDKNGNILIQQAELAMYMAKREGKNNCLFYSNELDNNSHEALQIIRNMRDSVSGAFKGFHLVFQPWVSPNGTIIGCEALLRWNCGGTALSPAAFIPVAEDIGLIIPLGEFVLQEAAKACRELNHINPQFTVSVNVSSKQLKQKEIFSSFSKILDDQNVRLDNIILEVTESIHLEDTNGSIRLLKQLSDTGIGLALDDFGTGYSSLSYLNQYPFDIIKMDREFIRDIGEQDYTDYLLTMMTELMHKMGRRICVEGVETEAQLNFCRELQVDIIQGFYFFRPMPLSELKQVLYGQLSQ